MYGMTSFLYPFGSPNGTGVSSVCAVSYNRLAALTTIGAPMQLVYCDFENADLIVILGTNPPTDSPPDKVKKVLAAKKWTTGFDELRSYVQQFPPEAVEKITRVAKETIITLARFIARAKGAYFSCGGR
jgi:anaerobic selenocysteine-containing dehydrogenase